MRSSLICLLFFPFLAAAAPTENAVKPVSPVAIPAFLDVVTFAVRDSGEKYKLVVTTAPRLLRVDSPDDGFSIIYDRDTDHYTGLEHRNYTWWEFSWADVREAVQNSKRYESRLHELNLDGVSGDPSVPATSSASSSLPDNAGYVWRPTPEHRKIADLDCVRWSGDTLSGDSVEAWCCATPLPAVQTAVERLRAINEPIELVPVRTLVPALVFPVYDGLVKGGVTPVLISWGNGKNSFGLMSTKTRSGQAELFSVPKLYMKTTLVTMDGIIDQKK